MALLDATGTSFEPARTAFPDAGQPAWARAVRHGALLATAHLTRAFVEPG